MSYEDIQQPGNLEGEDQDAAYVDTEASGERINMQDVKNKTMSAMPPAVDPSVEKISGSLKSEGGQEPYGGCDGPNAVYVTLVSSDNFSFIIKREMVLVSGTIKAMLSGPGQFAEGETNIVNLREIPSHLLERVCQYFLYKVYYTQSPHEIPKFPIEPTIALELLMAANFLDC